MSSSFNSNRRRFLWLAGCGLAAGGGAYTYARGIRVPFLHFVGTGPVTEWKEGGIEVIAKGAFFQDVEQGAFRFRAFMPEPEFEVRGSDAARIIVENIHRDAALHVETSSPHPSEARDNLARELNVKQGSQKQTVFAWRFPKSERFRFAAIGDSGGGTELAWVMKRAAQLEADFLVHVGDFYYQKGDLDRASANLNKADIPTYSAIGNHDFHKGLRAIYPKFNQLIGPSNSIFTLGGIEFVNFDTAAEFIPADRGKRAEIVENLRPIGPAAGIRDRVAFTHKPLADPDAGRNHDVDRSAEARWLREQLLSSGTKNLLVGHIHVKEEFDDQGLHTYVTGQGLAHADLILNKPFAEILLGDVEPGEPVKYYWKPLNMPFGAHCNARNLEVMDELKRPDVKARLVEQCDKA